KTCYIFPQHTDSHTTLLHIFFFTATATTEIYTLSLHDALPISRRRKPPSPRMGCSIRRANARSRATRSGSPSSRAQTARPCGTRSEEHTSELQSPDHLVCRLLLEKKKKNNNTSLDSAIS